MAGLHDDGSLDAADDDMFEHEALQGAVSSYCISAATRSAIYSMFCVLVHETHI